MAAKTSYEAVSTCLQARGDAAVKVESANRNEWTTLSRGLKASSQPMIGLHWTHRHAKFSKLQDIHRLQMSRTCTIWVLPYKAHLIWLEPLEATQAEVLQR